MADQIEQMTATLEIKGVVEHGQESNSGTMEAVEAHANLLQKLQEDHTSRAMEIEQEARETLQERDMGLFEEKRSRNGYGRSLSKNPTSPQDLHMPLRPS